MTASVVHKVVYIWLNYNMRTPKIKRTPTHILQLQENNVPILVQEIVDSKLRSYWHVVPATTVRSHIAHLIRHFYSGQPLVTFGTCEQHSPGIDRPQIQDHVDGHKNGLPSTS
jgi:hypothetical protein